MEARIFGVEYVHAGPAHLSIGQEATAVGQSFTLDAVDKIFGSHRSHGEVIAKGLSAIAKATPESLNPALERWSDSAIWDVVQARLARLRLRAAVHQLSDVRHDRRDIRAPNGLQPRPGRQHARVLPAVRHLPQQRDRRRICTTRHGRRAVQPPPPQARHRRRSIGDASTGCGPVWEAFYFAAMEQFKGLMDEAHRGGLPIVFFFVNNFYGMGGQTVGETMAYERLARIGAGINPHKMHAQTVDGYNPLAVIDAMTSAREHIEKGEGPVLIDYRPTASPAIRRPMRRPTARRTKSTSGQPSTRSIRTSAAWWTAVCSTPTCRPS